MNISARVENHLHHHEVTVSTENNVKTISIPSRADGFGSSVNGGELLFLAMATCFCNDIYREAARRKMRIESVEVTVNGEFGAEGDPGRNIAYRAKVIAPGHSDEEIESLLQYVDEVAEIHNTLRQGISLKLSR
jgi:organic hydroperoxide reductase OsmC/OhrA